MSQLHWTARLAISVANDPRGRRGGTLYAQIEGASPTRLARRLIADDPVWRGYGATPHFYLAPLLPVKAPRKTSIRFLFEPA